MKRFFINFVAALSALTLFFFILMPLFVAGLVAKSVSSGAEPALPREIVLQVDLRKSFTDQPQFSPFDFSGQGTPSIIGLIEALETAQGDPRVKGMYIRVGGGVGVPLAQAEEIRTALQSFKASGKFVMAHSQSFYSPGLGSYLAIAEADELWLQPTGTLSSTGIQIGSPFLKGFFEKIHAKPQFAQYHEYKSFANTFTQSDFTDAHRESYEAIVGSLYENTMGEIASSKGLDKAALIDLLNASPYLASEALTSGLVDILGYHADAELAALERAGEDAKFVSVKDYGKGEKRGKAKGETIAVVYGEGNIHLGVSAPTGGSSIGSDTVAKAIREAADNEDVKAIVFRVSSGGGSADASDQIWQAVNYAKKKDKPVVVTMGGVAASGGYYVAMSADAIFALPNTITGSIGVVGGKIVIEGTLDQIGIRIGEIEVGGPNTGLFSSQKEFSEEQWAAWRKTMGSTYDGFTAKAAQGRNMSVEDLHEVAKGRIWTGSQALELGLIDELGGYKEAIAKAKSLAGIEAEVDVRLKLYPAEKEPIERIMEAFGVSAQAAQVLFMFSNVEDVSRLIQVWEMTTWDPAGAQLEMTPMIIEP